METKPTDRFPIIEWDITNQVVESDGYDEWRLCYGEDNHNQQYTANALFCNDEFVGTDLGSIEKA